MNTRQSEPRDDHFVAGLVVGALAGAGLALWLAPRLRLELGQRVTDSASAVGARVGDAVDELARTGQRVRDNTAEAVARGAHEVGRYAAAIKTAGAAPSPTA